MSGRFEEFVERLNRLKNDSQPIWGKMSAQHMVEHLIQAVRMSDGKLIVKCYSPEDRLPTLKKILMSDRPLPRNFINPILGDSLPDLEFDSLETAKSKFFREIIEFFEYYDKNPGAVFINTIFGELNKDEWMQFHQKHFAHHFNQFGLMDDE